MYNQVKIVYNKYNESGRGREEVLKMKVSVEEYKGALMIFVDGTIKNSTGYGSACLSVRSSDNRYFITLFKDNKACIIEHQKELAEAADRFTEIVNTYFENEQ